ncbi:MAG: TraR/DksA C4-type zinc finger protein [bacterium]
MAAKGKSSAGRSSRPVARPAKVKVDVKAKLAAKPKSAKPSTAGLKKQAAEEEDKPIVYKTHLSKKDLAFYKDLLLKLRDRIIDEINFLANDNLNRSARESSGDLSSYSFHMADQGTDNFDREFAASLLTSEQDVLYEIDEAIRRIEAGSYGVCELSGKPIEKERLKVLPFARHSVAVQTEMERGKPRYRPFRRTSIQTTEAS